MELYTLDSLLRRSAVIDQYESLIWTERYSAWGDFELHIISTPDMRRLLPAGTRLAMSESYRVMTVELVENTVDADGRAMLKLSGRSLEAILEDRTARNTFANLQTTPKWFLNGKPGDIARKIFNDICRTNANFPDDQIPFLQPGTLFPVGNIAEPSEVIDVELALTTVYAAIKEICEAYDLGFRLVRNFDTSQLFFDIYSGNDRTTLQTKMPAVVFAPNLDNLTNISSVTSISSYKNVAYVFHPNGVQIVTSDGVTPDVDGFDRKVLTVDASDIEVPAFTYVYTQAETDAINAALTAATIEAHDNALNRFLQKNWLTAPELALVSIYGSSSSPLTSAQRTQINNAIAKYNTAVNAASVVLNASLMQRGKDELAKNRQVSAFDGELPLNSPYAYEIAYQLGDLVEMRNIDGVTNQMRVTEQIFVSDEEGERAYPTLSMSLFISPDTWFGWNYNDVWQTAEGYWADYGTEPPLNPGGGTPGTPQPTPAELVTKYAAYKGPVGTKLTVPTHVSPPGGQLTHPSVVDFGSGTPWNGYRYWMAHTPYPTGNDAHEDPNIVASNDGTTWVVPTGLTNPLDDQPGSPNAYNSDTELVFVDGKLYLFWRTYTPADPLPERMYMRTSNDGINWTAKAVIWETDINTRLMSPTLIYEGSSWTMYAVDIAPSPNQIVRYRSTGPTLTKTGWGARTVIPMSFPTNREAWHIFVRKVDGIYVGIINDCDLDVSGQNGDIYMMASSDGTTFTRGATVAVPRTAPLHTALYRSAFVVKPDKTLDCFYPGWTLNPIVWNLFRTTLS